eukprot:352078-Chlamydomonas_euryale.AAC.5
MADGVFSRVHTWSKRPVIRLVWGRGRPLSVRYPLVLTEGSSPPPRQIGGSPVIRESSADTAKPCRPDASDR